MIKKKKIGLVLALLRRNSSPIFCALLPQVSNFLSMWTCDLSDLWAGGERGRDRLDRTGGLSSHSITICRRHPICSNSGGFPRCSFFLVITQRSVNGIASGPASEEMRDAAFAWIDKLSLKNGTYPPDSYPNPGKIDLFYMLLNDLMIHSPCIPQRAITSKRVSRTVWSRIVWGFDGT